jgi:hypothetical protein
MRIARARWSAALLVTLLGPGAEALTPLGRPPVHAGTPRAARLDWNVTAAQRLGRSRVDRLRPSSGGLPVFGGDSLEVRDETDRLMFTVGDSLRSQAGAFRVDREGARRAATGVVTGAHDFWRTDPGWLPVSGTLRAAWRVDVRTSAPSGDWRVFVDAETGRVLLARDRRAWATGNAYDISPTEEFTGPCGSIGSVLSLCASAHPVELQGLPPSPWSLTGASVAVFGCGGADVLAAPMPPAGCAAHAAPGLTGNFDAWPDPTGAAPDDLFAEVNAYAQVEGATRYLGMISPDGPEVAGLSVYVNASGGGAPLANAFFFPSAMSLVVGQGAAVDYAYDGTVLTHEVAHAWIEAAGGLDVTLDALGATNEPTALGEGAADVFAASRLRRPDLGSYVAREAGLPALRQLGGRPTCRGSGAVVTRYDLPSIDGLSGEPHADGAIWSSLLWELREGLDVPGGCGPDCAAALQAAALRLVAGTSSVRFQSAADALVAAAAALFPDRPEIGRLVDCQVARHELSTCESRSVPLYATEAKVLEVTDLPIVHLVLEVPGADATVRACLVAGSAGRLLLRRGAPVETALEPTGAVSFAFDRAVMVSESCQGPALELSLTGPSTWFATVVLDQMVSDAVLFRGVNGLAPRPVVPPPAVCILQTPAAALPPGVAGGCGSGGPAPDVGSLVLLTAALFWRRTGRHRRVLSPRSGMARRRRLVEDGVADPLRRGLGVGRVGQGEAGGVVEQRQGHQQRHEDQRRDQDQPVGPRLIPEVHEEERHQRPLHRGDGERQRHPGEAGDVDGGEPPGERGQRHQRGPDHQVAAGVGVGGGGSAVEVVGHRVAPVQIR